MQVDIPYGDATLAAELPDRTVVLGTSGRRRLEPVEDLTAEVRRALAAPLGSPPVSELVRPGARVTIAFDDPTVGNFGPIRQVVIDELLAELSAAGVDRGQVTLICANALHRKFRPIELKTILGSQLVHQFGPRLICHDAEDADALVYLGQTPGGYDVEISRYVAESDLTIYVNAAHNRGFSGGWKSVCVGLSTYRSIRHHHTPDGMSMSLEGNRMHAMLDEMGRHLEANISGRIFKVDTINAGLFDVAKVLTGSAWETRRAAVDLLRGVYPARRELSQERFDVIVYGVPNWSPYSVFSSMNPLLTLVSSGLGYLGGTIQAVGKPGCTVVMVTPCPNEWDRVHHASYPDVWENVLTVTRDPWEIMHRFADRYASDAGLVEKYRHEYAYHPVHAILACYPLKRLEHVGQVYVAGLTDPGVGRHLGYEPVESVEDALAAAAQRHGGDFSIAYVDPPTSPSKAAM